LESPNYKLISFAGYAVALFFIACSVYIYSRNLTLKSSLDEVRMDYETLLSDKLQLERSYYRLKEERRIDTTPGGYLQTAAQFNDSLQAMRKQQDAEIARLTVKIEELQKQIRKIQ